MITPEDVTFAYQMFLGREPENVDVVNRLCENIHSIDQLRDAFLNSTEFLQSMGERLGQPPAVRHRHPFHLPYIPVETEVSSEELRQMFLRVQKEWEHLGDTEPYWSVVTQPQFYKAEFARSRDKFYTSGSHSCQLFLAALRRAGVNPGRIESCLELGCGVGRVTWSLAQNFTQVLAVDISSAHLQFARDYLAESGIANVQFQHLRSVAQLRQLPPVDAIFSLITLQHNPPPVMVWILRTLLLRLKPGGIAYIQIPTYRNGYIFEVERYLRSAPEALEMHFLPQSTVFDVIALADCQCLEVREDGMVGDEDQMLSNTFLVQKG